MHGRVCEGRNKGLRLRHMLTAPSRVTVSVEDDDCSSSLSLSSSTSFRKDGRIISVGDCALFKPPQDCPPFIGIIRLVIAERENKLKLGVNWLYRPAELKLGKGILLEAAPNEIFYSFHEDEIPAASLLHPCKVVFLPRGVEPPSGICSFVCRRVYDVTNGCLWWLTDQDYIDDRQQEVDQLLCKTRSEMHTTLQQGGRSPKSMNSPTTSHLKPGTDGTQNITSFPSLGKGRKRERIDHGSESVKRERSSRIDDSGSGPLRTESSLKSEIAKITEKGGLVDSEGVEKLVQLMLPERSDRKIDLVSRSMLAGVIAATDKFDCLSRFVQLRGLPVFDEWLQEVHKGKIWDGSGPKDSDRSVEDFLLILLRALDKLPVNLNALQTCNIGKSVNHLRSHKNLEIQKKARSIVDTWKKRVEAEMDAKSGSSQGVSWPGRPRHSEVSHGGRHSGGSADAAKTSATHLHASKSASIKVQVDNSMKSIVSSPSSTRSAQSPGSGCTAFKDGQKKNAGAGDVPITAAKDEKSSSSSQSHNNSQSCSSGQAKTGSFSGKEDARSSTAGSKTVNKSSGGSSRHRKSINGFQGSASSAAHRETGSSRSSSSQRNATSEKLSQSTLTSDKTLEVPVPEGCSNKLIVKLPSRGRSPAPSVSGGSFEDPAAVNSRASSPVVSEKHEQFDCITREKNDTYRANFISDVNAESWQSNDSKDILTGSDEAAGSPSVVPGDQRCRTLDDSTKVAGVVKATSPPSGNELKSGKGHGGSFSSMNALIESCVRYSETNACVAGADDVGMNLLASVAADEMSKSRIASPSVSQLSNSLVIQKNRAGNPTKLIASSLDGLHCEQHQAVGNNTNGENDEHDKQHVSSGMHSTDSENMNDSKPGDLDESSNSEIEDLQRLVDQCLESNENSDDVASTRLAATGNGVKMFDDNECEVVDDRKADAASDVDRIPDTSKRIGSSVLTKCEAIDTSKKVNALAAEHSLSNLAGNSKKEQKPQTLLISEFAKKMGEDASFSSGSGKDMTATNVDSLMTEKINDIEVNHTCQTDKPKNKRGRDASMDVAKPMAAGLASSVTNGKAEHVEENLESTDINERSSGPMVPPGVSPKGMGEHRKPNGSRVSGADGDEAEECTSVARDVSSVSASAGSDRDARVEFDLNEGFNGEDSRTGDSNNTTGSVSLTPTPLQLVDALPFPVPPISSGLPASITIAAAAKGPFVPPEDLLRNKGTVGWKGSAATSAFRPAEPRKLLQEVPLGMNNASTSDVSTSAGKQTRMLLDIDLNVPDESLLEDLASQRSGNATSSTSGLTDNFDPSRSKVMGSARAHSSEGLDLDLNKVDEPTDMNNYSMSGGHRLDVSFQQSRLPSGGRRDFDLNDGPAVDDVNAESSIVFSQHSRNNLPSQPTLSGIRVNGENMASFLSWFPGANTYSAVSIPPILHERGDQSFPVIANGGPQRMLGPSTGVSSFTPDVYRGPVLSSSPAVPFQSTTFQYPVFPFGTSFPLAPATFSGGSTTYMDSSSSGRLCFPAVNSQLLRPAVAVPSSYRRPYVVGLPNGSNSAVSDNSGKWFRSGFDLNSGPGSYETEARNESTLVPRQLPSSTSISLKEDQARMYQMPGGVPKRKEPDGGWDGYKQSSWQ